MLTKDYKIWGPLATSSWIKDLWEFICQHKIKIKAPYRILPAHFWHGDKIIMEEMYRIGYRETNLVRLNRVRNYLQVLYVSDIVEGNGNKIRKCIFDSRRDSDTHSSFKWRKEYPAPRGFALWRIEIATLGPIRNLPYTLGNWFYSSIKLLNGRTPLHRINWYTKEGTIILFLHANKI